MKTIICSVFLVSCISLPAAIAQYATFRKILDTSPNTFEMRLMMNSDSTFFMFGDQSTGGSTDGLSFFKLDKNFQLMWGTSVGDTLTNNMTDFFVTSGGYILATGHSFVSSSYYNQFTVKFDTAGNVVKYYNNSNPLVAGTEDNYGKYIFHYSIQTTNNATLVKTDTSGSVIWQKKFGLHYSFTTISKVFAVNGGYDVFGHHYMGSLATKHPFMAKFDTAGTFLWAKSYVDSSKKSVDCVLKMPTGGYLLLGKDTFLLGANSGILFTRVNDNGDLMWSKVIDSPYPDNLFSARLTPAGKLVLAGHTGQLSGSDPHHYFLIQTDSLANVEWSYYYATEINYGPADVFPLHDGFLYVHKSNNAGFPLKLYKLDLNGHSGCNDTALTFAPVTHPLTQFVPTYISYTAIPNAITYFAYSTDTLSVADSLSCFTYTGMEDQHSYQGTFKNLLYPVPAQSSGIINISKPFNAACTMQFYDVCGILVRELTLQKEASFFRLPALANGTYFVKMNFGSSVIMQKLIIN